ncbi:MAG: FtsX-like permease family protein, partial [Firmicutes bacterium]|nr:FtsX-like permease family protein [Bacillota bacterium]
RKIFGKDLDGRVVPITFVTGVYNSGFQLLDELKDAILYTTIFGGLLSGLLISNFVLNILETNRKRMGILCSMGARHKDIVAMFLVASGVVAVVGAGISLLLGGLLALGANRFVGVSIFGLSVVSVLVVVLLSLGVTTLMTLVPLKRLKKKSTIALIKSV